MNIISKILVTIIVSRPTKTHKDQTRENRVGFRSEREYTYQILTPRQIQKHTHTFRRPTIVLLLDLSAVFNSVGCEALRQCIPFKGLPKKQVYLEVSLLKQYWLGQRSHSTAITIYYFNWC